MPVLINQQTGLAEDVNPQLAEIGLESGNYALPLNDPQGNPVIAPIADAKNMMTQGFSQPNPEQLKGLLEYAKFSSTGEQLKTFAEGAAKAATFGLSTPIEASLGVNPEDIRARREINPGVHMAGELAGFAGTSLIPGVGAANITTKAGQAAQAATGLTGIAGRGVRLAAEGALFESGNQLSKMFEQDPNQTIQTAAADIGLAGLLTPVIGLPIEGAGAMWEATVGRKLSPYLKAAKDKLRGGLGEVTEAKAAPELLKKYPEVKAVLGENPTAEEAHQFLLNSNSSYGQEYRARLGEFKKATTEEALNRIGVDESHLSGLSDISPYKRGKQVQTDLAKTLEKEYEPFAERFKKLDEIYSGVALTDADKANIAQRIAGLSEEAGYGLSPSSANFKEVNRVLKEIDNIKTIGDLRKYTTVLADNTSTPELYGVGKNLRKILNEANETAVTRTLGEREGAQALDFHLQLNEQYRGFRELIDNLDDRLRVPKWNGPGTFIKSLKEMQPEDILKRITDEKDVGLLNLIQEKFPEVAGVVRETVKDNLLKSSVLKDGFNLERFVKNAEKMSPELREFALGKEFSEVQGLSELLSSIPSTANPSGTAGMADRLFGKVPWHMGALGLMASGNHLLGALTEFGGRFFTREVPDAVRTGWLRFLGKDLENPAALKAIVEMADKTARGLEKIQKGARALVSAQGAITVPELTSGRKKKLEEAADEFAINPTAFLDMGKDLGQWEPDHAAAMGTTAARAMEVIANARPKTEGDSPLDPPREASAVETAEYNRAVENVENPMKVLQRIKDGTVTPQDIQQFQYVYPDLHRLMSEQITTAVIEAKSQGKMIPYSTRMGLSLFLGSPLDSTLTPMFVQQSQMANQFNQKSPDTQLQHPKPQGRSMKALDKWSGLEMTPTQRRITGRK